MHFSFTDELCVSVVYKNLALPAIIPIYNETNSSILGLHFLANYLMEFYNYFIHTGYQFINL